MRIIGEIAHSKYKITVFKMNERTSVKIEDKLFEQIYKFRDGAGINNTTDVEKLLTDDFITNVDEVFSQMGANYMTALESGEDADLAFEII